MLELKDIVYQVEENNAVKSIIDHLDLTIGDGKFIVITGPNGGTAIVRTGWIVSSGSEIPKLTTVFVK